MAKYNVYAKVVGSKWIGVIEAESEAEAIRIGESHKNCHIALCHHCSDQCDGAEVVEVFAHPDLSVTKLVQWSER